jgi:predicted enzyme related to lactoylglutathione lyase
MASAFVWFHNGSDKPAESITFYEKVLGWAPSDGPNGMVTLGQGGPPFAALARKQGKVGGWIPYVQVEDVGAATRSAVQHGAELLEDNVRGPAGVYSVVRDPGGALLALWQKA